MMENGLQIFSNEKFGEVRVIERDGEPWFVAADVCKALRIANSRDALTRIDDDEKGVVLTDTLGGKQEVTIVNEPGLYMLVLSSRKPEARAFKRWITHEVIPTIRRTGGYIANEDMFIDTYLPDLNDTQRQMIRYTWSALREANKKITLDAPKVQFAEALETSKDCCLIGQLAKIICQNGYDIGANRLFKWMRGAGYLCKLGANYNMPTQQSIAAGWMQIKTGTVKNPNGTVMTVRTPTVTVKGQQYFVNKFISK